MNHCVSQACPGLNHFLWSQGHYSPLQLLFGLIMHHTHTHTLSFTAISRREQLAEESVDLMTLTETIARLGKNLDLM